MTLAALSPRVRGEKAVADALGVKPRTYARRVADGALPVETDRRGHPWTTPLDVALYERRDRRALTMLRTGVATLAAWTLAIDTDGEALALALAMEHAAERAALDAIAVATAERAAGRGVEAFEGLTPARYYLVRPGPHRPASSHRRFESIRELAAFLGESGDTVRRIAKTDAVFPMGRSCDEGLPTITDILVWETRQVAPDEDGALVRLTDRGWLTGAALGIRHALEILAANAARARAVAAMNERGALVQRIG